MFRLVFRLNLILPQQGKSEVFDSCDRLSILTLNWIQIVIFGPMWPWKLMEDPQNNRAATQYYVKLCATFQSHWRIQIGVTVRKCSIWPKIGDFWYTVTSKFDRWPWKIIGHISSATSSFVLHFIAIYQFKMELKSGNANYGSKSAIFCPVWPWNLADDLERQ